MQEGGAGDLAAPWWSRGEWLGLMWLGPFLGTQGKAEVVLGALGDRL